MSVSPIRAGVVACAVLLAGTMPATAQAAQASRGRPRGVIAAAGELVSTAAGRQLWGRGQRVQRPIASLTKVMTALVVVRRGDLRRRIRITAAEVEYVRAYGASNAGLHAGDILTTRALLYAMLLPSGADAAMALAQSYGPGITRFVQKMNALARKLHMRRTHFTNFDGLQTTDQSTPHDLLVLGQAAMRYAQFRAVVARRWYSLRAWPHRHHYFWRNTNLLLSRYPGVVGIKTGWTPVAGECLLFEATYRHKTLIGVLLDSSPNNSGESFVAAARLLNWAFGRHVAIGPATAPPLTPRLSAGG